MKNENGETVLSFWKGVACWGCILLWVSAWGLLAAGLIDWLGVWDTPVMIICVIGAGCFGVVPALFFEHERRKDEANANA